MESPTSQQCSICLQESKDIITMPTCKHKFCPVCMKGFIDTLKKYNLLTPKKLICMADTCSEQLPDLIIQKLYPGEEGFVLSVVRKRYKESKDPSIKIFNCKGFTRLNRQPLVDKPSTMGRDIHSKLMNKMVRNILEGKEVTDDKKICTNILSFNKLNAKEKTIQCYVCGVSYCTQCEGLEHEGKCQSKQQTVDLKKYLKKGNQSKSNQPNEDFQAYLKANQMAKCLNPKCGLAIGKQEGCYWVKCRCSWQFCYPCKKIWGECQHFSKYPYKKFIPPPQWMVKALKLY